MIRSLTLALLLAVAAPPVAAKQAPAPDYKAALADPARPAADRERDAARTPAELLAFAGVKPGQAVGDYVMGGGYLTRILAGAVGPKGKVYAFQPAEFIKFKAQYGEDQAAIDTAYANVDAVAGPFAAPAFPVPLDTIITVQNFHDLYLKPFPEGTGDKASAALFAALKPGGALIVVDHSAAAGSGSPSERLGVAGGCHDKGRRIRDWSIDAAGAAPASSSGGFSPAKAALTAGQRRASRLSAAGSARLAPPLFLRKLALPSRCRRRLARVAAT